jgi:hypothetical protein
MYRFTILPDSSLLTASVNMCVGRSVIIGVD